MASTRFGDKGVAIERLDVSAYTVPTDSPESDGTYSWDKTTIVIAEAGAGGKLELGYTNADLATAWSMVEYSGLSTLPYSIVLKPAVSTTRPTNVPATPIMVTRIIIICMMICKSAPYSYQYSGSQD